jgi:hypothetical protein
MQGDQSLRYRESGESGRTMEVEFDLQASAMCLDCPPAQSESRGDVDVAQSSSDRNEDLALEGSQGLVTMSLREMVHQMIHRLCAAAHSVCRDLGVFHCAKSKVTTIRAL